MSDQHTVFISSASSDESAAQSIADELMPFGYHVVVDNKSPNDGEDWERQLDHSLMTSDTYMFLVSPDSVRSQWVAYEMGVALTRAMRSPNVKIVPFLMPGMERDSLPPAFKTPKYST